MNSGNGKGSTTRTTSSRLAGPKGVIVLGHAVSEEPGMKICAEWLKTFITEVPVELIPPANPLEC